MGRTGTVTVVFTDIVGSTALLGRLGEREYDEVRRRHFAALRTALADHDGTEVKNTGDGLMAVFRSAVDAVDCVVTMQRAARTVEAGGRQVSMRIGVSAGEATEEHGDWFGTPVVEAARLCAAAGTDEAWATRLVAILVGSQCAARLVEVGAQTLKGFDQAVEVVRVDPPQTGHRTMYAEIDEHRTELGQRLVAQLDYWESLPGIQRLRADVLARLSPLPGDVVADLGCGTGTEAIRLAHLVGPDGVVIGVDPSPAMATATAERAAEQGVRIELVERDGRDTGIADARCDAVRCERVVQHIGDLDTLVAEARRITRPGGTVVLADTDWGSLMIHPGDPVLVRGLRSLFERGPMAEAWAGRKLPKALSDGGLVDVSYRLFPVEADAEVTRPMAPVLERIAEAGRVTSEELDAFFAEVRPAMEAGVGLWAFTMVVASGRVPD